MRVYSHDRKEGRRPLNELFDTFLHEVAHHLEYTEPQSFDSQVCRRVPGRMHSRLFWRILGELKHRWAELQARQWAEAGRRTRMLDGFGEHWIRRRNPDFLPRNTRNTRKQTGNGSDGPTTPRDQIDNPTGGPSHFVHFVSFVVNQFVRPRSRNPSPSS